MNHRFESPPIHPNPFWCRVIIPTMMPGFVRKRFGVESIAFENAGCVADLLSRRVAVVFIANHPTPADGFVMGLSGGATNRYPGVVASGDVVNANRWRQWVGAA